MKIAIITAMAEETLPILQHLGNMVAESTISGVLVRQIEIGGNTVYLATSGVGEIKAALTVQLLVDLFDIDVVLNFGFVGALNPKLSVGEIVACRRVCHYQFDVTQVDTDRTVGQYSGMKDNFFYLDPALLTAVLSAVGKPIKAVSVASGDKFVGCKKDKDKILKLVDCDICEMELAGLAIACERNKLPLFSAKVVSDNADDTAGESFVTIAEKGMKQFGDMLPHILNAVNGNISPLPPVKRANNALKA